MLGIRINPWWPSFLGAASGGGGGAPEPIYPVDDVGGTAPLFAYSTKKLRSAYSGSALRVVRPSDSATLDVGFVGQNLDEAALDTFLGSELGQVDIWYDQSGNGNDATQTTAASRPVIESGSISGGPIEIDGGRAVVFDTDQMAIPVAVSASRRALDVFSVVEPRISADTQTALFQIGSSTNQVSSFFVANTTTARLMQQNPGGNSTWRAQNKHSLYEQRLGASSSGNAQDLETLSLGAQTDVTMTGGFIGNTAVAGSYEGKFYASAFVGYGRDLSAGERTSMRDAMFDLFGITSAADNRIIFAGDSITAASDTDSPRYYGYVKMASRALTKAAFSYSVAGGGQRIQNQLPLYATSVAPILTAYTGNRIVFISWGTNDFNVGFRTDAQVYADLQSYCALVRAAGGKVIVATVLPATGFDVTREAYRVAYNDSVRTNWASFADGLCDFASNSIMGAANAEDDATLYPDGLHPSRLGMTYLAIDAAAAIEALLV